MNTPPAPLHWSTHDQPDAALLRAIDDGLDAHNQAFAPLGDVRPLACAAHTPDGVLIGGAVGRSWGGCVELQQLWVDEAWRHRGTARVLMQRFEDRARERGCTLAYLETFSFQAPGFYARLGYEVASRTEGFGEGIYKLHMKKPLRGG